MGEHYRVEQQHVPMGWDRLRDHTESRDAGGLTALEGGKSAFTHKKRISRPHISPFVE